MTGFLFWLDTYCGHGLGASDVQWPALAAGGQ